MIILETITNVEKMGVKLGGWSESHGHTLFRGVRMYVRWYMTTYPILPPITHIRTWSESRAAVAAGYGSGSFRVLNV